MTIRIFRDVEEAISREIRRINFFEQRSVSHSVLKEMFDPMTGEIVSMPIEPDFYDSSADTRAIHYPHFFVRLMRIREDRESGRVIPQYGNSAVCSINTSPKAYEVVLYQSDGVIALPGNTLTTTALKIRKIQPGFLIRLLNGENVGTYIVDSISPQANGNHIVTVSSTLIDNIPEILFNADTRIINFTKPQDLNTLKVGDVFTDSDGTSFNITAINIPENSLEIDGVAIPVLDEGSNVNRIGDVFENADPQLVSFIVMDPSKPILAPGGGEVYSATSTSNPSVPLDLFYLVRIDSNERDDHIDVANRMWEEFNPPRTGLPTIVRTKASAEQLITLDIPTGGSNVVNVEDNSGFNVNDPIFIFNDLVPTKDEHGQGFQEVFSAKVTGLIGTDQISLDTLVPDTFKATDSTKIVSNAQYWIYMFHLEDHVTRDVEGAQYWVHEFTFWVQVWIDRQGLPIINDPANGGGVVQHIGLQGNGVLLDGPTLIECN